MSWDIYASVRARIVYSERLNENIIEDMANAGSIAEALNYLRESSYYKYLRNIQIEDLELFELSLYSGLYRSVSPLLGLADRDYRSIAELGLLMIENKILSSIFSSLLSGTAQNIDLKLLEGTRLGEIYRVAIEERSLAKLLEYLGAAGMKGFISVYSTLTKAMSAERAIPIALDLGLVKSLSKAVKDFPSLAKMVCPENDYILINMAIRLSGEKLREYISVEELSQLACSIGRQEIEDIYSYTGDETVLNVLRKIYGPTLVQGDLEGSLVNIRGYIRKTVRARCNNTMSSYPFDPAVIWASIRIRMLDIEDIVAIVNGKRAGLPSDAIKKALSV